jgi:hypothetical protein
VLPEYNLERYVTLPNEATTAACRPVVQKSPEGKTFPKNAEAFRTAG